MALIFVGMLLRVSFGAAWMASNPFPPSILRSADQPPVGPGWIHEIKHDGFRILAHRRGRSVRLVTRNGCDLADHLPSAAAAIEALPVRSL